MNNQPIPTIRTERVEAPGAKAARICGILAIVFALTCVGIPVAIILGIVALVQQSKAKGLAREFPQEYRAPSASGLVLGILGLVLPVLMFPFVGLVSAIAIPALIAQRERGLQRSMESSLSSQMGELASAYHKGKETGLDESSIHAALEQLLESSSAKNPTNPQAPAFRHSISAISGESLEEVQRKAEEEATEVGELVFVVSYPSESHPTGYLAGAGKLRHAVGGSDRVSEGTSLD